MPGFLRRARHCVAVFAEPSGVEVLRARRGFRSWRVLEAERHAVAGGETLFDALSRLAPRPPSRRSALLLVVSRAFHAFHREVYPRAVEDRLDEALSFDWQENSFLDPAETQLLAGPPVASEVALTVPVFALRKDVREKFAQALSADNFDTFTVVPEGLACAAAVSGSPEARGAALFARVCGSGQIEIHRLQDGLCADSVLLSERSEALRLFRESLPPPDDEGEGPLIRLLASPEETARRPDTPWRNAGLPVALETLSEGTLAFFMKGLFRAEEIRGFDASLRLRPLSFPRVAIPAAAMLLLYAGYAGYQVEARDGLRQTTTRLTAERAQVEARWKPIEELQQKIARFQEDRKKLGEMGRRGYPVLQLIQHLSEVTPLETWITAFSVQDGKLIMRGESESASKYLSELSKIEGMEDVKFGSPVSRNPTTNRERFHVEIKLNSEKLARALGLPDEPKAEGKVALPAAPAPPPPPAPKAGGPIVKPAAPAPGSPPRPPAAMPKTGAAAPAAPGKPGTAPGKPGGPPPPPKAAKDAGRAALFIPAPRA